jgi:hypothetical protein
MIEARVKLQSESLILLIRVLVMNPSDMVTCTSNMITIQLMNGLEIGQLDHLLITMPVKRTQLDFGRMTVVPLRKNALDSNTMEDTINVLKVTLSGEFSSKKDSILKPIESLLLVKSGPLILGTENSSLSK